MKFAEDFGFLPENDGAENAIALQSAVFGGGEIRVRIPGTYDVSDQIVLEGNTTLIFSEGVYIRRQKNPVETGYVIINRGAYQKSFDENIKLIGLKIICNGIVADGDHRRKKVILGLKGHVSFFYVKNLEISDFECLDLPPKDFAIHVCTFENARFQDLNIAGKKDGVHLGRGKNFTVKNGRFRTYDDPIALNAHDYVTSNPELGWIEDGLIEDCVDLDDESTVGYFCRILAGSWCDWYSGMKVQRSDTVVSNGRIYRVTMPPDGKVYVSKTRPTHASGDMEYDGFVWSFVQDGDEHDAGCRNVKFKNIRLEKKRSSAFSIHFDKDEYSRSYYPNSKAPIQENISFENVSAITEGVKRFVLSRTPVRGLNFKNCAIGKSQLSFWNINEEGIRYPDLDIRFEKCLSEKPISELIECQEGISVKATET